MIDLVTQPQGRNFYYDMACIIFILTYKFNDNPLILIKHYKVFQK